MKITITGRHVNVHETLKSYAEEKAAKLERYMDGMREIEIVLSAEGDLKTAEMIAHPRKGDRIVGQTRHEDQFAAVDLLIDKMSQQLRRTKEKIQDRRKRSGRVPDAPLPSDEAQDPEEKLESYDEVVDKFGERFD